MADGGQQDLARLEAEALKGYRNLTHVCPHWDKTGREALVNPTTIVIHGTGSGSSGWALANMLDPTHPAKPSAHFLITEAAELIQLVPLDNMAWHAGRSAWRGRDELNQFSFGIEVQNPCSLSGPEYSPQQMDRLIRLLRWLMRRDSISSENIVGHSCVAPGRKQDPGPKFPWRFLEREGVARSWQTFSEDVYNGEVRECLIRLGFPDSVRQQATQQEQRVISTQDDLLRAFVLRHCPTLSHFAAGWQEHASKYLSQRELGHA